MSGILSNVLLFSVQILQIDLGSYLYFSKERKSQLLKRVLSLPIRPRRVTWTDQLLKSICQDSSMVFPCVVWRVAVPSTKPIYQCVICTTFVSNSKIRALSSFLLPLELARSSFSSTNLELFSMRSASQSMTYQITRSCPASSVHSSPLVVVCSKINKSWWYLCFSGHVTAVTIY